MSSRSPAAGGRTPTLHLARARLDAPPQPPEALGALLSEAERERAARFRFERHRRRFEVATGLLRTALGAVLDLPPGDLVFDPGEHGKPSLAGGPSFNQSHSGEWWVLGWSDDGRVGVDVEVHRELPDLRDLARHTFHPREADGVLAMRGEERRRAFFRVWTRKEAFIKALGLGLSYPLDRFVVGWDPGGPESLLAIDDARESEEGWRITSVGWDEGLSAAVAWDRPDGRLVWRPPPGVES